MYPPAAMQLDAAAHQIAFNPACCAPAGFGVDCTVQRSPFHRSASAPAPGGLSPTATQSDSVTQDTAFRPVPGRVGMCCRCQVRPFHRRARGSEVPRLLLVFPTAMHADGAVQATPLRVLDAAPGGLFAASTVHLEPFHRSACVAGDWWFPFGVEYPTAVQAVPEVHATPISW